MANTEFENALNAILAGVKSGTADVETLLEERGTDARGKDAVLAGKWKIGDYVFSYTIPAGRKYGKSSVERTGSDLAVDTFGVDKTVMCVVYFLRNPPKPRKPRKAEVTDAG